MITQIRNTLENARRHLKAMSYPVASDDCRIALENLDNLANRQKRLVNALRMFTEVMNMVKSEEQLDDLRRGWTKFSDYRGPLTDSIEFASELLTEIEADK